ncbi:MAG: hypothetical protein RLZZ50_410, partial [Verrucomicrobiota bacterium]
CGGLGRSGCCAVMVGVRGKMRGRAGEIVRVEGNQRAKCEGEGSGGFHSEDLDRDFPPLPRSSRERLGSAEGS